MRHVISLFLAIMAVLSLGNVAYGYLEKYGPFEDGKKPKLFPLKEVVSIDSKSEDIKKGSIDINREETFYSPSKKKDVILHFTTEFGDKNGEEVDRVSFSVENKNGVQVFKTQEIDPPLLDEDVYCADLNQDGKPDFIVFIETTCNGWAGVTRTLIILSSGNTYKAWECGVDPGENTFIDIFGNGRCQFLWAKSPVYGGCGKDGKEHNYCVYNLYEFTKDGEMKLANHIDKMFPIWIMLTNEPNHKPTSQLTSNQKERLWEKHLKRYVKGIFNKYD